MLAGVRAARCRECRVRFLTTALGPEGCRIALAVAWPSAGYGRSVPALRLLGRGTASTGRLRRMPGLTASRDGCVRVCLLGRPCGVAGVGP